MMNSTGALGKVYQDGEVIIRQGEVGNCMYVIQEGQVEVLREDNGEEQRLMFLEQGEFFGEMAVIERDVRSATVRAKGATRILTVDENHFLRRIHEDPSLAYRIVQTLSSRIRDLDERIGQLREGSQRSRSLGGSHRVYLS
jgi:CRP-like cAMP-binding protein